MEKKEQIKNIILVFSTIMKSMITPLSRSQIRKEGITQQTIGKCLDLLEADFGDAISRERLVDFCVCQAYRVYNTDSRYTDKWGDETILRQQGRGMLHPDEQEPEVLRGQMAGR